VPVAGLVTKVHAGFQHLAHGDLRHELYSEKGLVLHASPISTLRTGHPETGADTCVKWNPATLAGAGPALAPPNGYNGRLAARAVMATQLPHVQPAIVTGAARSPQALSPAGNRPAAPPHGYASWQSYPRPPKNWKACA